MRLSDQQIGEQLTDILAQARAIRFATQHGVLSYESAKRRVGPLLKKLNEVGMTVARKYKRKYRKITFSDL